MSHVAKVDIEVKDLAALKNACSALGLELVEGQKQYRWFGRSVGDYPLPAGFTKDDLGKCDHAIRIPGNARAYEIGVVARKDGKAGFHLLWDSWLGGYGMQNRVGQGCKTLKQHYGVQVAIRQVQKQGYRARVEMKGDGSMVVRATK